MTYRTSLVLAFTAALSSGCGTFYNLTQPGIAPPEAPTAKVCRVYGGVRGDWPLIWDYPLSQTKDYADYVFIPLWATVDIVLSAFGDTLTLPYTAAEEVRRMLAPSAEASFTPASVPEGPAPIATPATLEPDAGSVTSPR